MNVHVSTSSDASRLQDMPRSSVVTIQCGMWTPQCCRNRSKYDAQLRAMPAITIVILPFALASHNKYACNGKRYT